MTGDRWWAGFLLGFLIFGAVIATSVAVQSDDVRKVVGAAAFWTIAGSVALGLSIANRRPRWLVGGLMCFLMPLTYWLAEHGSRRALALIVTIDVVAGVVGWLLAFRETGRLKELDRLLSSESGSVAFVVTMAAAVAYSLLESVFGLPRLRMFWVVAFGCWAQTIASFVLKRRYG